MAGELYAEFVCTCGMCGQRVQVSGGTAHSLTMAREVMRGRGWHTTRSHGWVCVECRMRRDKQGNLLPSAMLTDEEEAIIEREYRAGIERLRAGGV